MNNEMGKMSKKVKKVARQVWEILKIESSISYILSDFLWKLYNPKKRNRKITPKKIKDTSIGLKIQSIKVFKMSIHGDTLFGTLNFGDYWKDKFEVFDEFFLALFFSRHC